MMRVTNHGLFIITLFVYHKLLEARMYFVGTSEQIQSPKNANLTEKYLINVRSLKIYQYFSLKTEEYGHDYSSDVVQSAYPALDSEISIDCSAPKRVRRCSYEAPNGVKYRSSKKRKRKFLQGRIVLVNHTVFSFCKNFKNYREKV